MTQKPLTQSENPSPDDVRAVLAEIFDYFGGPEKALEITGHTSGRSIIHTWTKNGIPAGLAFTYEVLSNGHFKAAEISHEALAQIQIYSYQQRIAAANSARRPKVSACSQ